MEDWMKFRKCLFYLLIVCSLQVLVGLAVAQTSASPAAGSLKGKVTDPSGAVITHATITAASASGKKTTVVTNDQGIYEIKNLAPGKYTVTASAPGFATDTEPNVVVAAGPAQPFDFALSVAAQEEKIQVEAEGATVGVNPAENASSIIIKGADLEALSDDPDELQSELQALAGPSAGPNGGQIYIDGFTGGQIPPKSSIREIRVNQNPFSAEFDKIGYGRIEILTKPGSDKFSGHVTSLGNDSAWNTGNPLVKQQPSYYLYFLQGDVNGPLTKSSSYFFSL